MNFDQAKAFLENWGLHFDTEGGYSTNIPYPQPYQKMRNDAVKIGGESFSKFVGSITDTTDGESYLALHDWKEIQVAWESYNHV